MSGNRKELSSVVFMLAVSICFAACAPSSKTVKREAITGDISGLVLDKSQKPTLVYKRPGAPTLAAYKRFIIDPVQVNYSDPKMKNVDPKDVRRMQQYFRKAMTDELRKGGYEVGSEPQPGTLKISAKLSGFNTPSAAPNVALVIFPVAISVGEVTVESIFREAISNRIDAVVIDRSKGSRFLNPSPWSTWADLEATFDKWAEGVRESIDKAHASHN